MDDRSGALRRVGAGRHPLRLSDCARRTHTPLGRGWPAAPLFEHPRGGFSSSGGGGACAQRAHGTNWHCGGWATTNCGGTSCPTPFKRRCGRYSAACWWPRPARRAPRSAMMSREKIQPEHLARPAFVYVRQSTLDQVRHHHESQRLQYGLADHARALGWREVVIIDDDLGKSGASAAGRVGFQRLVATVGLGQVGAILGSEVSRLARNNRDWYQLLDLCGLLNTLIIDTEGIYDPRQLNDRLLLGLKGTMSEAELGWIRQRAHEGLLAKARRGALILGLPVGYVQTRDGRVEKHPDQRVQHAISLVFAKFAEVGSVRQTLLWFRQEPLTLPSIEHEPAWGAAVTWRLPVYNTILKFLANPFYAGAYAFGRTGTHTTIVDGVPRKTRGHRREREEWIAFVRDHHEPYISWDIWERNRALITHNAQMKGLMVKGAVRRGPSLIAGLLRCGRCGRRLHVTYSGTKGYVPRYSCRGADINHGAGRCIAFGGLRVDEAIEREILRVLAPGAIEAALATADATAEETTAAHRALELVGRARSRVPGAPRHAVGVRERRQ